MVVVDEVYNCVVLIIIIIIYFFTAYHGLVLSCLGGIATSSKRHDDLKT